MIDLTLDEQDEVSEDEDEERERDFPDDEIWGDEDDCLDCLGFGEADG